MPAREKNIIKGWTKSLTDSTADIVFFGDSITYGGDWLDYYDDLSVCSLAIPGDSIQTALYRIDMIEGLCPEKLFVMIGVNNVGKMGYEKLISEKFDELVEDLTGTGAKIYVQSILPVRDPSDVSNQQIDTANEIIRDIADNYGCTYINLHDAFSDENGELLKEVSKDGVHINEKGYALWNLLINKYVYE